MRVSNNASKDSRQKMFGQKEAKRSSKELVEMIAAKQDCLVSSPRANSLRLETWGHAIHGNGKYHIASLTDISIMMMIFNGQAHA